MHLLHTSKDEWQEPHKFIPERFDPESPYYLTPGGKKRNPLSFSPFLGGKRICLGKTFAEASSKIVGPTILMNFAFEFSDPEMMNKQKPSNNMLVIHEPHVFVKIKQLKII